MLKKFLVASSLFAVAAVASAGISANMVPVYSGPLPGAPFTVVSCWDLQVTVTGNDVWTAAGGRFVGAPWLVIRPGQGTFYQDPVGGSTQPNPAFFPVFPNLQYDSFYTSHLGWPNVAGQGQAPGFAFGPADTPTQLAADWFLAPTPTNYPGTFTIARATVIPTDPGNWWADYAIQVASRNQSTPLLFTGTIGIPEPASLALLALGALALRRR